MIQRVALGLILVATVIGAAVFGPDLWLASQSRSRFEVANASTVDATLAIVSDRSGEAERTVTVSPGQTARWSMTFRQDAGLSVRCADPGATVTESLGYVTSGVSMSATIRVEGCSNMRLQVEY